MTVDINKLKALALAARDERVWPFNELAFRKATDPATVLELIAEVERLRAKNGGLLSRVEAAETRMDTGSEGGHLVAAPAAGTEKDAERLLTAIVRSDVGIAIRHKLEDGQGTKTDDGRAWLAAIEFVAAKEPPCGS